MHRRKKRDFLLRDSLNPERAGLSEQEVAELRESGYDVSALAALCDRISAEIREAFDRAGCDDSVYIDGRMLPSEKLIVVAVTARLPDHIPPPR